jgi:excisionase family DNA binding protein
MTVRECQKALTAFDMHCHIFSLDILRVVSKITRVLEVECGFFDLATGGVMRRAPKSELMTTLETCQYLKITQRTLYRYLQSRQIPAFKLGKEWRFVRSDLEQWIRDRTRTAVNS